MLCPLCSRDISCLDPARRETHVAKCTDRAERQVNAQKDKEREIECVSGTQDTRLADARAYGCPHCGRDLSNRLLRARIAHLKKCGAAVEAVRGKVPLQEDRQGTKRGHVAGSDQAAGGTTTAAASKKQRGQLLFGTVGSVAVPSSSAQGHDRNAAVALSDAQDQLHGVSSLPATSTGAENIRPRVSIPSISPDPGDFEAFAAREFTGVAPGRRKPPPAAVEVSRPPRARSAPRPRQHKADSADTYDDELQLALAVSRSLIEQQPSQASSHLNCTPVLSPVRTQRHTVHVAARVLVRAVEERARADVDDVVERANSRASAGPEASALKRLYLPRAPERGIGILRPVHSPTTLSPGRASARKAPISALSSTVSPSTRSCDAGVGSTTRGSELTSEQRDVAFPEADELRRIFDQGISDMGRSYRWSLHARRLEYEAAQRRLLEAYESDVAALCSDRAHKMEELRSLCCVPHVVAADKIAAECEDRSPVLDADQACDCSALAPSLDCGPAASSLPDTALLGAGSSEVSFDESSIAALEALLGL